MTNHIKLYTAGKMSGIPFEDQMKWRSEFEYTLRKFTDEPLSFIHPPMYYNYEHLNHKTEAEIKEWELNKIRECDIVVVDLNDINTTVGTHIELGFINAVNMLGGKHIYVVGIGDTKDIHPWIDLSLLRCEPDIESACRYITEYLLV